MAKQLKVPRGTQRKLRREAWAHIRVREMKNVSTRQFDPIAMGMVDVVVQKEVWKPTFAEFTARQGAQHG